MKDGARRDQPTQGQESDAPSRSTTSQARIEESLPDVEVEDSLVKRIRDLLRESDARFREFAEASSDVLWIRDAETLQWEYVSPAFETVYGISREAALNGNSVTEWVNLILPEDRDHALDGILRARAGERVSFEYRTNLSVGGQSRWLRSNVFPILDEHGKVRRIGGIGRDITALKLAYDLQQRLHAELQHRVRNTLAVIRSIVRRTAENSASVEDFASHLDGRIGAFSRVQIAVTRDPLSGVDLAELVSEELRASTAREGEHFSLQGPPVRLKAKAAESMALAIHELATNALKHGALTVGQGRIDVRWLKEEREGEAWLSLEWKESGMKGRPVQQGRDGFGTTLLRHTLRYDLGAEVTRVYEPNGFRCEIAFPLPDAA
jgi:PAS domain S-box-containing protein